MTTTISFKYLLFGSPIPGPLMSQLGLAVLRLATGLSIAFGHGLGKLPPPSPFVKAVASLGFPLPEGMETKHLLVAAIIAGLGLTVALFVAGKAYDDPAFQDPAKMGAVLSAGAAIIAFAVGRLLKVKDGRD